jgi:heme-degrading monooxygenase HmoA
MAFTIVWEFKVAPGSEAQFEQIYGPQGGWAELFRRERSFIRSELLHDMRQAGRYVTIDRWESEDAYETFRAVHEDEYQQLDECCEVLTTSEQQIGRFSTADEPQKGTSASAS